MNIYVANLPFSVDELQVEQLFRKYGTVEKTTIIKDKETGKSKGFGFVEMPNEAEANNAILGLHQFTLEGRKLTCRAANNQRN
ncbi:MAG TPA: RNA-binding protein [Chitinophagales bacterium]|nr:RNA-binding protein [Myxococcales bacterium]HQU77081.1 RNA-binding protein [Chitinophagales bacterium]